VTECTDHNVGHLSAPINGRNPGEAINWGKFNFPGLIYLSAHINEKNSSQAKRQTIRNVYCPCIILSC
jgi:hypothetical protein